MILFDDHSKVCRCHCHLQCFDAQLEHVPGYGARPVVFVERLAFSLQFKLENKQELQTEKRKTKN